jgi:DNA-binding MarR family transcriptional regulator
MASATGLRVEEIANDLFEVVTQVGLSTLRGRRRVADLKEVEFLTLSILHAHDTMIVGDIQRHLGVLPAQMSRIIRALESRDRPLIACRINPRDKRKIDVCLTAAGEKALLDYRNASVSRIVEHLRHLAEDDQEDLTRSLEKLTNLLGRNLQPTHAPAAV